MASYRKLSLKNSAFSHVAYNYAWAHNSPCEHFNFQVIFFLFFFNIFAIFELCICEDSYILTSKTFQSIVMFLTWSQF